MEKEEKIPLFWTVHWSEELRRNFHKVLTSLEGPLRGCLEVENIHT